MAESVIQCHCFLDRSYNPADKFAADEYILATSFNSLLARSFDISKRQIIMIKMNEGMGQDDLLVGLKVAQITGIDIRKFLRLRQENIPWAKIVADLKGQEDVSNDDILRAVSEGMSASLAGTRIADEAISRLYGIDGANIKKLQTSGLSVKEINLVFILAHASGMEPGTIIDQNRNQGKSWSEIAYNFGLEPDAVGKRILAYPGKTGAQ